MISAWWLLPMGIASFVVGAAVVFFWMARNIGPIFR